MISPIWKDISDNGDHFNQIIGNSIPSRVINKWNSLGNKTVYILLTGIDQDYRFKGYFKILYYNLKVKYSHYHFITDCDNENLVKYYKANGFKITRIYNNLWNCIK